MSRSIDPVLRDYLRARIQEWVSEDGHTAKGFAKLADISGAQVSDAINKGSIGWTTMDGAMRVFGFKSVGALEAEAEKWAATRAPAEAAPTSRRGYRRLHERQELAAVAAVVTDEHGELDPEDIAAAGRFPDDELAFAGPLDAPTVAGLAAVLGARRKRLAKKALK